MANKKRIVVGGTFDIIHLGHIKFLWAAKRLSKNTELIVIVARDSTVHKLKNRQPIFNEQERLELVQNLKPVDRAILGKNINDGTIFDILLELRPDIVALGFDQVFSEEEILKWSRKKGLNIKVVRLPKFEFKGIKSSSEAREKISMMSR